MGGVTGAIAPSEDGAARLFAWSCAARALSQEKLPEPSLRGSQPLSVVPHTLCRTGPGMRSCGGIHSRHHSGICSAGTQRKAALHCAVWHSASSQPEKEASHPQRSELEAWESGLPENAASGPAQDVAGGAVVQGHFSPGLSALG